MIRDVYLDGTLRERWDDDARLYTTYNQAGAQIAQRAYTLEENTRANTEAAQDLLESNQASIEVALDASLLTLQAIIDDTNANINANPAARIKDLARVNRRLIRLVIRRFDGTT